MPLCFTRMLYLNGVQQQYENTNASKRELKLIKTFSISSFERVKIKLSNISDPFVKNVSSKLRIVGFRGARATLKCPVEKVWLIWFQHKTKECLFFDLYCSESSWSVQLVMFCAIWVSYQNDNVMVLIMTVQNAVKCDRCTALCATTP